MSIEMAAGPLKHHQSHQPSPASLSPPLHGSFLLSCPNFSSDIFYGADEENGCFYSLGIMEKNFSKSHQEGMVPQSPKLEDFLGCSPKLGSHPYSNIDREALAQNNHILKQGNFRSHYSFELLQQPLHEGNEMYQEPLVGEQMFDYGFHGLKNWVGNDEVVDKREVGFDPVGLSRRVDLNPLSLSMSHGSLSSCVTASQQKITSVSENEHMALVQPKKRANVRGGEKQQAHKKSIGTFGQRTSQYRGVTRHRWTGRYEAHLWDNSCKKEGQIRKGRQVYLGGYNNEERAARAYDLAALKYWGPCTRINFTLDDYQEELMLMKNMSRQEYVAHLRRKSSGFSRGASIYRGVTRHHRHGRWQARIGRVSGNKDLYLGTFGTQEEAAEAYDIAAIKFRGANAVTNFSLSRYDVKMVMGSRPVDVNNASKPVDTTDKNSNRSEWRMATSEELDHQSTSANGSHHSRSSSANLNGFLGMASGSSEQDMDYPNMITNTSSSRDGCLNSDVLPMVLDTPSSKVFSWVSSNQLKNDIPMTQMPIYASWSDV